jgi:hypothetical protein
MADFVAELEAWSHVKRSFEAPTAPDQPDVADLKRRIDAKTGPSQQQMEARLARTLAAREYFEPWKGVLERQVGSVIQAAVPTAGLAVGNPNDLHAAGLRDVHDLGNAVSDVSVGKVVAHSGPIGPVHVMLECLLGQTLLADRPFVRLVAGQSVLYGAARTLVWSDSRDAPLDSALHQQGLIELIHGLRSSARVALEEFAARIEELTTSSNDEDTSQAGERSKS